ncbi:hypothetical protein Tcan_00235 [Toxocara canis]|uniref:Uncharacterized protein n=1 Tax=Toxocara canis TaxID=6265 RepID=A0A0B2V0J3_TOXCA|nr:hypothetical protein Tcan_00235 [Toxocara canis]
MLAYITLTSSCSSKEKRCMKVSTRAEQRRSKKRTDWMRTNAWKKRNGSSCSIKEKRWKKSSTRAEQRRSKKRSGQLISTTLAYIAYRVGEGPQQLIHWSIWMYGNVSGHLCCK